MSAHVYEPHTPQSLADWQKYLSHVEIDLLAELAQSLPANPVVVNIGAGAGTSGLTFMTARPDLHLVTIDIADEVNLYGGLGNERGIFEAAGVWDSADEYGLPRYLAILGNSVQVGQDWDRPPVEMIFIDGGHEYEECRGDIEAWLPHLYAGGVVAIHDYRKVQAYQAQHPEAVIDDHLIDYQIKPYYGVDKATDELLVSGRVEHIATVDTLIAFRKAAL